MKFKAGDIFFSNIKGRVVFTKVVDKYSNMHDPTTGFAEVTVSFVKGYKYKYLLLPISELTKLERLIYGV